MEVTHETWSASPPQEELYNMGGSIIWCTHTLRRIMQHDTLDDLNHPTMYICIDY